MHLNAVIITCQILRRKVVMVVRECTERTWNLCWTKNICLDICTSADKRLKKQNTSWYSLRFIIYCTLRQRLKQVHIYDVVTEQSPCCCAGAWCLWRDSAQFSVLRCSTLAMWRSQAETGANEGGSGPIKVLPGIFWIWPQVYPQKCVAIYNILWQSLNIVLTAYAAPS